MSITRRLLPFLFILFTPVLTPALPFEFGFVGSYVFPFYTGAGYRDFLADLQDELGSDKLENNPIVGFGLGVTAEHGFSSWFSLQGELHLAGCGGGYVVEEDGRRSSTLISELNLQLPVLARFRLALPKGRSLYAMAGPQLSLLLHGSEYAQDGAEFQSQHKGTDDYYGISLGMLTALGWEVPMGRINGFLEFRYARDFTSSLRGIGYNVQNVAGVAAGFKIRNGGKDR